MSQERLEEIENALSIIDKKLDRLIELFETDGKKMSNHIDFIENIYESVKTPFTFIMDSVKNIATNRITENDHVENLY